MAQTVEFWFDVGSPAAYLAFERLPAICRAAGATLEWRPMLLGGVFQATGNHSPATIPAKGRYLFADLQRFAARHGTAFAPNPHFPINTLTLMRGAVGLQLRQPARFVPYLEAVYRAIWAERRNMNDGAVVAAVLREAEFDPEAVLALAAEPDVKERLKAQTQEAVARGVFGAPTFFVGGEMYWGQDRLDFVKEALEA
ncbi:2-hydroxychromene-2-carboxylate isomerase [Ramlibacter sp.]|uniref:2-hydroxychromene-2-carboxylate isomerase n=1 Tax=Ramlibacter sp. TaxID=1917967 RepID=UPI002C010E42|nr:2-hydroxychromene-2-carboxylate isomerase [Ramlibacter sp.]HWI84162.1 2-hydroxychromene-2-carboxylate isomerase [Ramlibacter sp.]